MFWGWQGHPRRWRFFMQKYNATILIVEDEESDRMLIEKAFRDNGVTTPIHAVAGGLEAIAYMMGERIYADRAKFAYPTFIITDLKMPGADGFTVLQHLKSNPAWAIIPTVVLSASSDLDDLRTSYQLGASSYHVKPQRYEELRNQLKILHDYWMTCQVPEVDLSGKQLRTESKGKLGERFPQPTQSSQSRTKG